MKPWLIALLIFLTWGCSHTHHLNRETSGSGFEKINSIGKHYDGKMLTNSGEILKVKVISVSPDTTSFMNPVTEQDESIATAEIKQVEFVRHGKGALEGMGLGLLIGGLTGAIIGYADGDDQPGPGWNFILLSAEEKAAYAGIGLGGAGLLLGLFIGAASGSKDRYVFFPEKNVIANQFKIKP